jgi:hypothetical protein
LSVISLPRLADDYARRRFSVRPYDNLAQALPRPKILRSIRGPAEVL